MRTEAQTAHQPTFYSRRSWGHSQRVGCPSRSGRGRGRGRHGQHAGASATLKGGAGKRTDDGTTECAVHVDTVWWQVGCSGHAPPQTVEFAPPPPIAIAGRADGVSRLTD